MLIAYVQFWILRSRSLCFIQPWIKIDAVLMATKLIPPVANDEANPPAAKIIDNELPINFNFL